MNRLRLRNVCEVPFFSTEVTWEKLKSDVDKYFLRVASTIIRTDCFFHLSGFFVEFSNQIYVFCPSLKEKKHKFMLFVLV